MCLLSMSVTGISFSVDLRKFFWIMQPSTNDAQLVRVQERLANGDTPLYSLEYTLDSSRGQKKILSAVTVASKKLYILNITYVDSAAAPAPPAMAEAYEQVLNSFDLVV